MTTGSPPQPRLLGVNPLEWARAHPTFFFTDGQVSAERLLQELLGAARTLGSANATAHSIDEWFVVGAEDDWFVQARHQLPEDFSFKALTPFPELGQNCVRPEAVVAAFARDTVVLGPTGVRVVKGTVGTLDNLHAFLAAHASWRRAVAFRRVEA